MDDQGAIKYILDRLDSELSTKLKYHAPIHTKAVINNCKKIGKAEGISDYEMRLLLTAAAYHDSGFLIQYDLNENFGCDIAQENLPEFGYSDEEIQRISEMIMATRPPQQPGNKLEMILCDADLYYFGGDHYREIAEGLFEELNAFGKKISWEEWEQMQIDLLKHHQFYTDFARTTRGPKKQLVLQSLLKNSNH